MGVLKRLKDHLVAGIIVAGPVAITLYIGYVFLRWADWAVSPIVPEAWDPDTYLPIDIPGFGLIFGVLFLTVLGALTASVFGRWFVGQGESAVSKMPFIRSVYKTTKQIFETLVADNEKKFSHAALLQWPRLGVWSVVFVAGEVRGELRAKLGSGYLTVFIPTTPNPTGGYMMFVAREDIIFLDMSLNEAAEFVLSAGLSVPTWSEESKDIPPIV